MANEHVSNALDWQHGDAEPSAFALQNAQIEATLALAYEQRTANLLAALQPVRLLDNKEWLVNEATLIRVRKEIGERLYPADGAVK